MRTIEDTLSQIRKREADIRGRQAKKRKYGLTALSLMLTATLVFCCGSSVKAVPNVPIRTAYGSIMIDGSIGGYVIASVIAFMAGVIVTVVLTEYLKKRKHPKNEDDRN